MYLEAVIRVHYKILYIIFYVAFDEYRMRFVSKIRKRGKKLKFTLQQASRIRYNITYTRVLLLLCLGYL